MRHVEVSCQRLPPRLAVAKVCNVGVQRCRSRVIQLQWSNHSKDRGEHLLRRGPDAQINERRRSHAALQTLCLYLKVAVCSGATRLLPRWPELESREVTVDSGDKQAPSALLDSMLRLNTRHMRG